MKNSKISQKQPIHEKAKFLFIFALLAVCATLVWVSCEKEKVQAESTVLENKSSEATTSAENSSNSSMLPPSCDTYLGQVQNVGGMLSFTDMNHFQNVVECLENEVEEYNAAIDFMMSGYPEEKVNYYIDSLGINEDQPLVDFEAQLGFLSLRRTIEVQLDAWLDNTVLNPSTNPDNHIILDEETRALLTPDCKAIIGGQVVDFCDPYGSAGPEQISLCSIANGDCCWWGGDVDDMFYNNQQRQIFVYVSLRNKPGFDVPSKGKAKVLSCGKKSNGKWKRWRTDLRVAVSGVTHDNNECDGAGDQFFKSKPPSIGGTKKRAKLRVATNTWFSGLRRALDNEVNAVGTQGAN